MSLHCRAKAYRVGGSELEKIRTMPPRTSLRQRAPFEGGGKPGNLVSLRVYERKNRTVTHLTSLRSVLRQQDEFEGGRELKSKNFLSPRAYEGKIGTVTPRTSLRSGLLQRAAFQEGGNPGNLPSLRTYEEKVRTVLRQQAEFEGGGEPKNLRKIRTMTPRAENGRKMDQ